MNSELPREQFQEALSADDITTYRTLDRKYPELLESAVSQKLDFHFAAGNGAIKILKYLLDRGVDVNIIDDISNEGAIHTAAHRGHLEVVKLLLRKGATINREIDGRTVCRSLLGAAIGGHLDVVKCLVKYGAVFNFVWVGGMTPLDRASSEEMIAYLRSIGAKSAWELTPRDLPKGRTALLNHFKEHRGKSSPLELPSGMGSDPSITIHVIPASRKWPGQTLFTSGMSDRPIALSGGGACFAELVLYLPKRWPLTKKSLADPQFSWPVEWMLRIANHPHTTGEWSENPCIIFANGEPPQPLASNTELSCIMCMEGDTEMDMV